MKNEIRGRHAFINILTSPCTLSWVPNQIVLEFEAINIQIANDFFTNWYDYIRFGVTIQVRSM